MGSHPLNLGLRFLLELASLIIMGIWGWQQSEAWFRFVLVLGLPLCAASIWGVFAVPNDPSRSGRAPIAVPGIVRLIIEFVFFVIAAGILYEIACIKICISFCVVVILHYLISYDRIGWLLKQR